VFADDRAGDRDPLTLAAGEGDAASPHHRRVPQREFTMNSCALASVAARTVSSISASGRPYAMFSQIVA